MNDNLIDIAAFINIEGNKITFPPNKLEYAYSILHQLGCRCTRLGERMIYFQLTNNDCRLIKYRQLKSTIYLYLKNSVSYESSSKLGFDEIKVLNEFSKTRGILNNFLLTERLFVELRDLTQVQITLLTQQARYKQYHSKIT